MLALTALAMLWLAPAEDGRLLLLPLDGTSADAMMHVALAADARPLARGPLPGSLIVDGSRPALAHALGSRAVLVLKAPVGLCSEAFA